MNEFRFVTPPPVTYQLWLTPAVCINCVGKVPNRLHRWMMGMVFGFRFVVIKVAA
jgi:hypothetical protein